MPDGFILTNAGKNALAKSLTGKTLSFTRAWCGDGILGTRNPRELTSLINPKRELPIQSMNTVQGVGTCELVVEMSNKGLTQGFFVREYGLFALDPETQREILYAYRNAGDEAGYLEGENGIDLVNYTLSIVTVIDQAPNVSAVLASTNQYVTISRLDSRFASMFGEYMPPSGFWTFSRDNEQIFRPATIKQAKSAMFGDVDVLSFNSRIERLEDAMNQTMLQLELLNEYPGFSHYSAEDFKNVNQIDLFTANVTSIVAGDDSIDVTPIQGMLPGSLYTLTDGIHSETIQVKSINLENGIQRVILTSPVKNTYILEYSQIYRTSARIDSEQAIGPNARKKISWEPTLIWKGTGAQESFSTDLDTSVNNQRAYTFSGNVVLNSSGLVSLA